MPRAGALHGTGDLFEPYRLVDGDGVLVLPAAEFLRDLQAAGRSAATQRSYAYDLLRWFRFCWAVGVPWGQATRVEARDFCCWIQRAAKPARGGAGERAAGTPNPVTGRPAPGLAYAAATVRHCETVLRGFYEYHLQAGTGPIVNPFPLARPGVRAHAHHNPMEPFGKVRAGLFRPRLARRVRGRFLMSGSMSCSPGWARTGTGRWWRCGSRPVRVPRSCWGLSARVSIQGSSWSR